MSTITNDDLINFDEFPALGNSDSDNDNIFDNQIIENELTSEYDDPFDKPNNEFDNPNESELINNLLLQRGITDSSKIQIEDEEGNISEVSFDSLPLEDKLEILQYSESPDLDDSEIETINFLRENNVSLEDLINYQRDLAVQEYLQSQNTSFQVDQLSDEELYKLEIKSRFEKLTDEELDIELQKELNNPDLFKKKVERLREIYKEQEIEEQNRLTQEAEAEEQQNYDNLVNTMVDIAQETSELFDLELEDSDKEEVLQFLLTKDVNGQSEFAKILNDPKQLFNLAWFAIKGQEAFDTIHDYYKKEIDSVRKAKGTANMTSRTTVVKKETKQGDDPYDLNNIFKN